jgi:hypothetical protein
MEETLNARWTTQPMSMSDVLFFSYTRRPYEVVVSRGGKERMLSMAPVDAPKSMFSYNPPFTAAPSFIIVDGLCLMTTCRNMMETGLASVLSCKTAGQLFECTWVVVTNVVNGSRAAEVDSVSPGDIVTKVNGKEVSAVEEVMDIVAKTGAGRKIVLETDDGMVFTTTGRKVAEWRDVMKQQRLKALHDARRDDEVLA